MHLTEDEERIWKDAISQLQFHITEAKYYKAVCDAYSRKRDAVQDVSDEDNMHEDLDSEDDVNDCDDLDTTDEEIQFQGELRQEARTNGKDSEKLETGKGVVAKKRTLEMDYESAFQLFVKDLEKNRMVKPLPPSIQVKEINRRWRQLSDEDRLVYIERAESNAAKRLRLQ